MRTSRPTRPRRGRVLAAGAALTLTMAACAGTSPQAATPGTSAQAAPSGTTAPTGPLPRYAGYQSQTHDDPSHWVCRPEAHDICQSNLDATAVAADGSLTPERFEPAADPPIDCFYVYPTISRDQSPFSDWSASPDEEGWVTLNQAGRLRSTCRLFAPVYRQMTLSSLAARLGGGTAPTGEPVDPYADVLDAFRTYMAKDNNGRPFVLIGHSQGSQVLQRLVTEEIDPNADVLEKMATAFLAGWTFEVPEGADVGGQFKNIPLCRAAGQTGCLFAWSSYRASQPPTDGAFFGKARTPGRVAACVTPATLADGPPVDLHSYFPADPKASIIAPSGPPETKGSWVDPSKGTVTTPFVTTPGLTAGACATTNGYHHLSVTIHGDPADPRADELSGDLTPQWGQHLNDVNLVMGDIVDWVNDLASRAGGR